MSTRIITFDDIPNQFDPVFGFVGFPPVLVLGGYAGFEYAEDSFVLHARIPPDPLPFTNVPAHMNYSIAQSSNYFISATILRF